MVNPLHILLPCAVLIVDAYHGADLPPGPYCGTSNECCRNREDDCSYPILDTLCYCDEHCVRTHDDCCPDYEAVCLGIHPPPEPDPVHPPENTKICTLGTTRMEECNLCVCNQTFRRNDWDCEQEECMMNDNVVSLVNQGETWTATKYANFTTKKLKDGLIYKLGTMPIDRLTLRMNAVRYDKQIQYPIYFDSRTRWPGFISPVQDQGWCGADWAVTIAGVASDRFAIQSSGSENIGLSPQTMLSCNIRGQQGCEGGHIDIAWNFVGSHGLVDEVCFPYKAMKTPCPYKPRGNLYDDHCKPLLPKRTSRYKVGPPLRLKAEEDIMYEIMDSGPVHAIMTVYQDFFHYRSGVYRHTPYGNEVLEGHHSVRIIGWGEERGEKYWIVANSWGPKWGEDGYFRIKRGVNECRIESFVLTVLAEVTEA